MIFFDEGHVVESVPVIFATSEFDSEFVCGTQSRDGFARVQNNGFCACNSIHELVRHRGDTGHALQEVERNPFATENGLRWSVDGGDKLAYINSIAVRYVGC